jgi:hypothetical protein
LVLFEPPEPLKLSNTYIVDVYKLKPTNTTKATLAIALQRDSYADADIPTFKAVCLDSRVPDHFLTVTAPSTYDSLGNIELHRAGASRAVLSFELTDLTHTTWHEDGNSTGNPSVWMVSYTGSAPTQPPSPTDWPCNGKKVSINGAKTVIYFDMCPLPGGQTTTYEYSLHMQQMGHKQFSVDIGIDPRIVDHPN